MNSIMKRVSMMAIVHRAIAVQIRGKKDSQTEANPFNEAMLQYFRESQVETASLSSLSSSNSDAAAAVLAEEGDSIATASPQGLFAALKSCSGCAPELSSISDLHSPDKVNDVHFTQEDIQRIVKFKQSRLELEGVPGAVSLRQGSGSIGSVRADGRVQFSGSKFGIIREVSQDGTLQVEVIKRVRHLGVKVIKALASEVELVNETDDPELQSFIYDYDDLVTNFSESHLIRRRTQLKKNLVDLRKYNIANFKKVDLGMVSKFEISKKLLKESQLTIKSLEKYLQKHDNKAVKHEIETIEYDIQFHMKLEELSKHSQPSTMFGGYSSKHAFAQRVFDYWTIELAQYTTEDFETRERGDPLWLKIDTVEALLRSFYKYSKGKGVSTFVDEHGETQVLWVRKVFKNHYRGLDTKVVEALTQRRARFGI